MPLFMVLAFGYTFGGQVHEVRTLVANDDMGPFADRLLANVTGDTVALLPAEDAAAAREEVRAGRAWAALVFPSTFSQDLSARQASLRVFLDGSSPTIVAGRLRGGPAAPAGALPPFQVQVVGSLPLAFGILLLFAVGNQGLGMMLSAAARNELQAVQFIPLVLFPS